MKKEVIVLVLGLLLAQAANPQSSAPASAQSAAAPAQANASVPTGKTAGEVMKNVQVLKYVPASQWNSVMAFVAGSLGVTCEH